MDRQARVCPFCGELPGTGVFCAACGRNLGGVEQLPTRSEWEVGQSAAEHAEAPRAEGCAEATASVIAAMEAAGRPGLEQIPIARRSTFGRTRKVEGWVMRPVDRDDDVKPRRYEPGLFLSVHGRFHRLDNELRGWGQRDFPYYEHSVGEEPIDVPCDERLLDELNELLRRHS
jgi:hypothetical protein